MASELSKRLTVLTATFTLMLVVGPFAGQADDRPAKRDSWEPVCFLIGQWEGTAEGEPGVGTVKRTYSPVLHNRYIYERNVSTYASKKAKAPGEIHEHWSFLSRDKRRDLVILRQFHQEGFVNQYALDPKASGPSKLVFQSECFENFDNRWKARETYEIRSADEFIETFELAPPGLPYKVYSRNRLRRVRS